MPNLHTVDRLPFADPLESRTASQRTAWRGFGVMMPGSSSAKGGVMLGMMTAISDLQRTAKIPSESPAGLADSYAGHSWR